MSPLIDRLTGINAVREALQAGGAIDRVVIARGRQDTRTEEIVQLARGRGIPVRFEDRSQIDRLANTKDHQGVVALAAARAAGAARARATRDESSSLDLCMQSPS